MADQEDVKSKSKADSVEIEKLAAIVNAAVSAAMKEGAEQAANVGKSVAEAIIESKKPYESPQMIANRASARKASREQAARIKRMKETEQKNCPHIKGCNGTRPDPYDASIIKHVTDTGEVVGFCTSCNKEFSSLRPEDVEFLRKSTQNQTSRAGVQSRFFEDPISAQRARLGLDQKEIFVDSEGNLIDYNPKLAKTGTK